MNTVGLVIVLAILLPLARAGESATNAEMTRRPIRQVLDYFAVLSKHNIVADAKIEKIIVDARDLVEMPNLAWGPLLEAFCARNKLRVDASRIKDNIIHIYRPARVSISFRDADLRDVITSIAVQSGQSVVVDADVQGTVTAVMTDIDWDRALDAVVKSAGYILVREKDALRIGK